MLRVVALVLALAFAAPVSAQPPEAPYAPPQVPSAPDIVAESARRILEGIRRLIDRMPMYEAPRMTPEGDIILKRIRPPFPEADEAKTGDSAHDGVDL
jgi:hypothetical protein